MRVSTHLFLDLWLQVYAEKMIPRPVRMPLPTREDQVKALKSQDYDILIIGGGATGAGCVLDACTRGAFMASVSRSFE